MIDSWTWFTCSNHNTSFTAYWAARKINVAYSGRAPHPSKGASRGGRLSLATLSRLFRISASVSKLLPPRPTSPPPSFTIHMYLHPHLLNATYFPCPSQCCTISFLLQLQLYRLFRMGMGPKKRKTASIDMRIPVASLSPLHKGLPKSAEQLGTKTKIFTLFVRVGAHQMAFDEESMRNGVLQRPMIKKMILTSGLWIWKGQLDLSTKKNFEPQVTTRPRLLACNVLAVLAGSLGWRWGGT